MADDQQELLQDPTMRAWWLDSDEFPAGGSVADALRFCVRYAVLAPSGHNAQPWWFHVDGTSVTVGLDVTRGLPVLDPDDRESLMSVGAAAFTLRVALAHFGFPVDVSTWPDPTDPHACLRLDVSGPGGVDAELDTLFDAITRRRTSRAAFYERPVPDDVMRMLVADAEQEGAALSVVADQTRRLAVAELVSVADREQMSDRRFRRELASWIRPTHSHRLDGIHWHGSALAELLSAATPLVLRTFDLGDGEAARDHNLAVGSPLLAVLTTPADDRSAWLSAGQALGRVLLRAAASDLSVGYLNQPVEVEHLRPRLSETVRVPGVPQLLLRLGYGPLTPPQPRRPAEEVLGRA